MEKKRQIDRKVVLFIFLIVLFIFVLIYFFANFSFNKSSEESLKVNSKTLLKNNLKNEVNKTSYSKNNSSLSEVSSINDSSNENVDNFTYMDDSFAENTSLSISSNYSDCTPKTCLELGKNCGNIDDGCGSILSCGTCSIDQICFGGLCMLACTPKTCLELGKNCGNIDDGCGSILSCGTCSNTQTCSNGLCVNLNDPCANIICNDEDSCTRDSCSNGQCIFSNVLCGLGQYCSNGTCVNNCNDECVNGQKRCVSNVLQSCGNYDGDSCLEFGGDLVCQYGCSNTACNNQGCISKTCSELGKNCGNVNDSCGKTLNCGSCNGGQICSRNNFCIADPRPGNPISQIIESNTDSNGDINETKVISEALPGFNVDYINYFLRAAGVQTYLHSAPFYGNPVLESFDGGSDYASSELIGGNINTVPGRANGPDIRVISSKEEGIRAMMSSDPTLYLQQSKAAGRTRVELIASQWELGLKGYKELNDHLG